MPHAGYKMRHLYRGMAELVDAPGLRTLSPGKHSRDVFASSKLASPTMSDQLFIYTVYDHPLDYPNSYVVKKWMCNVNPPVQDANFLIEGKDLELIRDMLVIEMGLTLLPNDPIDDEVILENYI